MTLYSSGKYDKLTADKRPYEIYRDHHPASVEPEERRIGKWFAPYEGLLGHEWACVFEPRRDQFPDVPLTNPVNPVIASLRAVAATIALAVYTVLSTADPAAVLREVKAETWDAAIAAQRELSPANEAELPKNPYRGEA